MSLILYPNTGYDAFISVANCDAFLTANVIGTQRELYDALTVPDREIYIRQATTIIKGDITLPDTLEQDLQDATAYFVNYSVGIDVTNSSKSSNVKIKEITDLVTTEYFSPNKDVNALPDIVSSLLKSYNVITDGTFTFERS